MTRHNKGAPPLGFYMHKIQPFVYNRNHRSPEPHPAARALGLTYGSHDVNVDTPEIEDVKNMCEMGKWSLAC